jgi:hypothetical protein
MGAKFTKSAKNLLLTGTVCLGLLAGANSLAAGNSQTGLTESIKLFQNRRYQECAESIKKLLPSLTGINKSKAALYLAYSAQKTRKLSEAEDVFQSLINDHAVYPRHRTEACIALAKQLAAQGKKVDALYWQLLAVPYGHPKHRKSALKFFAKNKCKPAIEKPTSAKRVINNDKYCGINLDKAVVVFDRKSGLPAGFWSNGAPNCIFNSECNIPIWRLNFKEKESGRIIVVNSFDVSSITYEFNDKAKQVELKITYKIDKNEAKADAIVTARCEQNSPDLKLSLTVNNYSKKLQLWEVQFPTVAVKPFGKENENMVVIPWRRGRLIPLKDFSVSRYQEYPGSSARFQLLTVYNKKLNKGLYFSSEDSAGNEKIFSEFLNVANGLFCLSSSQFPANRGVPGNSFIPGYSYNLKVYNGDWYDAAKIYRRWWQKQKWANKGPLALTDEVPEWLKKTPVIIRFYLRDGKGCTIEKNMRNAKKWNALLDGRPAMATLYHYAKFKEPLNKPKYPVAEYYGYCAEPYPGLLDFLKELKKMNIRPCVFLQSEIFNQDYNAKDRKYLTPALKINEQGKPVKYLNERWIACRKAQRWQQRYLEMVRHVLGMGFQGLYMDTFGKNKIDNECFNSDHGHSCGGGCIDSAGQRDMGRKVKALVKSKNKGYYIGGEACVEAFPDLMDYKLNATNIYKQMIPVERAIYGEYILSHGRVIRNKDEINDCKMLGMNFLEGVIPGRYYSVSIKGVPASETGRSYLKKLIRYNDKTYQYLRLGEMLRPLKFSGKVPEQKIIESVSERKVFFPALQNAVYRSWKDKSIGIGVINISDKKLKNKLIMPAPADWNVASDAKIYSMSEGGKLSLVGELTGNKKLPLTLAPNDIKFFVVK